ncbi:hypothetical protein L1987_30649 [Smallanthus sonchifolius]|uniref:Uncharacterized protein n=1 Tax=Smallanthus sonchifolius TaxID=185202 RepID=A0ACB9I4Q9_9ASTR|nr:hypothetical protein L1987_30649 [Smallanthus sonchifolius]
MSSSSSYNSPCAACKFLRRKCIPGCVFSPYFPPEDPQKFVHVHKIFGASNVTKLLSDVLPHQREDAVSSLAYEAEARVRDPVYGCVGVITVLQRQVDRLQKDLDTANAELMQHVCNLSSIQQVTPPQRSTDQFCARRITGGGFYQPLTSFPYHYVNRTSNPSEKMSGDGGGGNGGGGGGGVGNM